MAIYGGWMATVIIYHKASCNSTGLIPTAPWSVYGIREWSKNIHHSSKNGRNPNGDVANTDNPTFFLSDFDSVLWQKISALYQ
jgi:hypothetical protein